MKKLFLLFIFFTFYPISFSKTPCYVITGIEKEKERPRKMRPLIKYHKNAFTKGKIGPKNCVVLKSWKDLDHRLNARKKTQKKEKILIFQGAHGSPGGDSACDGGETKGKTIYNYLKKFSQNFHVGAGLLTCYSGDILKYKLINDLSYPKDKSVDNLCLLVSSFFGRSAKAGSGKKDKKDKRLIRSEKRTGKLFIQTIEDETPKKDIITVLKNAKYNGSENLETIYAKTSTKSMISSVPWETIGISRYFQQKEHCNAARILNRMMAISEDCNDDPCSFIICLFSFVSSKETLLRTLLHFNLGEILISKTSFNYHLKKLKNEVNQINLKRKNDGSIKKYAINKTSSEAINFFSFKCYSTWIKELSNLTNLKIKNLAKILEKFQKSPVFKYCIKYKELAESSDDFLFDPFEDVDFTHFDTYFDIEELQKYLKALRTIKNITGKNQKIDNLKQAIQLLSQLNKGKKIKCDDAFARKMLDAIFGWKYFKFEEDESAKENKKINYFDSRKVASPLDLFFNFLKGSLNIPYENHIDKRRQKACRDFTLD